MPLKLRHLPGSGEFSIFPFRLHAFFGTRFLGGRFQPWRSSRLLLECGDSHVLLSARKSSMAFRPHRHLRIFALRKRRRISDACGRQSNRLGMSRWRRFVDGHTNQTQLDNAYFRASLGWFQFKLRLEEGSSGNLEKAQEQHTGLGFRFRRYWLQLPYRPEWSDL